MNPLFILVGYMAVGLITILQAWARGMFRIETNTETLCVCVGLVFCWPVVFVVETVQHIRNR